MTEYEMASLAVQHEITSLGYVQAWIALGVGVMQCGLIGWGVFVMQGSTASRDATLLALQNQGEALKNQGEALRDQREAFQNQGEVLKDQGAALRDQGEDLKNQGEVLKDQGAAFQNQREALQNQGAALRDQGEVLAAIGAGIRELLQERAAR